MKYICIDKDASCVKCWLAVPTSLGNVHNDTLWCSSKSKYIRLAQASDTMLEHWKIPDHLFRIDGIERKTERMLELLDKKLLECKECPLHMNGHAKPYWTPDYKGLAIVGEAPGVEEVSFNTPFCGQSGGVLTKMLNKYNIQREHCLIINTVNCRPVDGKRNGKPSSLQIEKCRHWRVKYFGVTRPKKVLLLGNYPLGSVLNEDGITSKNATMCEIDGVKYIKSVHPAYALYARDKGLQMLENSVKLFSEV